MNTPLFSAVDAYVKKDRARFHVPGHKGNLDWLDQSAFDVTEADGCDELYRPNYAIAELETRYAHLYKSEAAVLSAGGSSLCIQTMLALAAKPGQKIICGRGVHVSAVNTMALLDLIPAWVFPETDEATGLAKPVTVVQIREALAENPDAAAVYITSPDYFGCMCDIAEISKICREFSVPLLVDNAHGAYLRFLSPSLHPINLGAAMCADSLHKTLPVLTGGAVLHINDEAYTKDAKRLMSVFASTSPSYLIMLSADKALETLETDFAERVRKTAAKMDLIRETAKSCGFLIPSGRIEPLKLTIGFGAKGYCHDEFVALIRENGIEPEMVSDGFCVLMASPCNTESDFERLESFIKMLPTKTAVPAPKYEPIRPEICRSPREATLAKALELPLDQAAGKIAGSVVAPCPPGIPAVVPGECIDQNLIRRLKRYGISHLNVLEY